MATIYLIRHAEKPAGSVNGVDENGLQDPESLTPRGWQRAGALAVYFHAAEGVERPDQIYASPNLKEKIAPNEKEGSHSKRPAETVTPVAARLGRSINLRFVKDGEADLAAELVKQQGVSLVAWQHEAIPRIAGLVIGRTDATPAVWPGERFDVIWRLTRASPADSWSFAQICPELLAGDSGDPIPISAPSPVD